MLHAGGAGGVAGIPGVGAGTGTGGGFSVEEEDVRSMLGLFAQLGKSRKDSEHRMDVPTFQSRLSAMPVRAQFTLQQALNSDAIVALLEKIGPSILLTHSQSRAFGWPVADARVDLVKAILAVEPNGPPFFNIENVPQPEWYRDAPVQARPWGITAVRLTYDPVVSAASELVIARQEKPDGVDLARCWEQKPPARQLPRLKRIPILILTAEASYHAPYDHCTVKYLEQAGVHPTWIKLAEIGVHGNGHMMMLEKNNVEIAQVMAKWLLRALPATEKRAR